MTRIFIPVCVICGRIAITTAVNILVCQTHWEEYSIEAAQYLDERPFYKRLLEASKMTTQKEEL